MLFDFENTRLAAGIPPSLFLSLCVFLLLLAFLFAVVPPLGGTTAKRKARRRRKTQRERKREGGIPAASLGLDGFFRRYQKTYKT